MHHYHLCMFVSYSPKGYKKNYRTREELSPLIKYLRNIKYGWKDGIISFNSPILHLGIVRRIQAQQRAFGILLTCWVNAGRKLVDSPHLQVYQEARKGFQGSIWKGKKKQTPNHKLKLYEHMHSSQAVYNSWEIRNYLNSNGKVRVK